MSVSEIVESYVEQMKAEGWCLVEGVIPENQVDSLCDHVQEGHKNGLKYYEEIGGSLVFQSDAEGKPHRNAVSFIPGLAAYFGDERVVGIAKALLDPHHIRIAQTEFKTRQPGERKMGHRGWHSDFPHDLTDRERAGVFIMPFPNVVAGITALWMLSDFSPENGGTWVVPRSHRDLRNPRSHLDPRNPPEMHDDIPINQSIPGEIQLEGKAGSVVMIDSRIWHTAGNNPSDEPRVTMLTRYSPWWMNLEFGGRNQAMVPRAIYERFPEEVKLLYKHRVEGEANPIQRY